jgi:Xaa-Pro aminopeptidase
MAVVPASVELVRNHDVHHVFRQDSDFHYLTGFHEPDAVAVITPGHDDGDFHLFVRPRDRETETWTGYRTGVEGAKTRFAADTAYELDQLDDVLPRLMLGRDTLFYRLGNPGQDSRMTGLLAKARSVRERFGRTAPVAIHDIGSVLAEMRLHKSAAELDSLRAACELSALGHAEAMRFARPGLYEYQVQAAMEFLWREGGSPRNGYPSIVASGPNAVILHYVENDREIEDGDLILIDAAAEIDMYSSDITRTFPASGEFTLAQRSVYEVVLEAERAGIRAARPGSTLRTVQDASVDLLVDGLIDLGLVPGDADQVHAMHLYREFFMHGTSHWLGLDVHDAGAYRLAGAHRRLEPGMCFTVEPGIYIAPDRPEIEFTMLEHDLDVRTERRLMLGTAAAKKLEAAEAEEAEKITHRIPEEFLGIGVRIEDDIAITDDGHENLTYMVPVDIDHIEALCGERTWLTRE